MKTKAGGVGIISISSSYSSIDCCGISTGPSGIFTDGSEGATSLSFSPNNGSLSLGSTFALGLNWGRIFGSGASVSSAASVGRFGELNSGSLNIFSSDTKKLST